MGTLRILPRVCVSRQLSLRTYRTEKAYYIRLSKYEFSFRLLLDSCLLEFLQHRRVAAALGYSL